MGVEQAGIHAAFDIVATLIIYFGLEPQLAHLFFNWSASFVCASWWRVATRLPGFHGA